MLAVAQPVADALPASGQSRSFTADLANDGRGAIPVPDDGATRAGRPLRFRDNGDGTITDLNTQLVWEKKCAGCEGLHDARRRYRWSGDGSQPTIWDWLEEVNAAGGRGLGGRSDWRIPNVVELVSILDYGRVNPTMSREFHSEACAQACSDSTAPDCSCTAHGEYWTSTTFADFPAHAYVIFPAVGLVNDRVKTNLHFVRAVRGGE